MAKARLRAPVEHGLSSHKFTAVQYFLPKSSASLCNAFGHTCATNGSGILIGFAANEKTLAQLFEAGIRGLVRPN